MEAFQDICRTGVAVIKDTHFKVNRELALILVVKNKLLYSTTIGTYVLCEGQIEILNIVDPVRLRAIGAECEVLFVSFNRTLTDSVYNRMEYNIYSCNGIDFFRAKANEEHIQILKNKMLDFIFSMGKKEYHDLGKKAAAIIYYVCKNFNLYEVIFNEKKKSLDDCAKRRFKEIGEYFFENITDRITLNGISSKMHISRAHLCREFSNKIGQTFSAVLNLYKTVNAAIQLLDTDNSLTYIAENSGFSSTQYYNTVFKKHFGCLPSKFRKDNKNKDDNIELNDIDARCIVNLKSMGSENIKESVSSKVINLEGKFTSGETEIINRRKTKAQYILMVTLGPDEKISIKKRSV